MRVGDALRYARSALKPLGEASAFEARLLLADALGRTPSWVLAHDDRLLAEGERGALEARLDRRLRGEPLPYILGRWEFYGRSFRVTPEVLIPRPETELLVEAAVSYVRREGVPRRVADVGTGSGCIAVSLAAEVPGLTVVAADVSLGALRIARTNAREHGVSPNVLAVQTYLLDSLPGPWDLLCANLPYLPGSRLTSLPVAVWEPRLALSGGAQGTELVAGLVRSLARRMAPGGLALLEIDEGQADLLEAETRAALPDASVEIRQDLRGLDRLLSIRRGSIR